jgi:hypothetical protein
MAGRVGISEDLRTERLKVFAIAVAIVAAAVVLYVGSRTTTSDVALQSSPAPSSLATPSGVAVQSSPTLRRPGPPSSQEPFANGCPSTELRFTGVFDECVAIDKGQACPSGSFDQARVVLLHGTRDDFLLYVEVNGAYHGPGTYALTPWPHAALGVPDGVAKVAIREYVTGRLWESSAGSVTIDNSEEYGHVYAGLGASTYSPVDVELNIAGWWSCS